MAVNRLTGFSGFDVDSTVEKMMEAEKTRLTKVKQSRQYKVWEQEAYRDVIDQFNAFKSEYFDVLKSDKNFTSATSFAKFSTSATINGTSTSKVSIKGGATLKDFNQTIDYVTQLATKDKYSSSTLNVASINTGTLDFGAKPATFKATMVLGGVSKTLEIDMTSINDKDAFGAALKAEVSSEFGSDYANMVDYSGSNITIRSSSNTVTLLSQTGSEASMTWLGVASGTSTSSYSSKSVNSLLGLTTADLSTMTINGKSLADMGVLETSTMSQMITKINDSGVGVTASYDSLNDKFVLSASAEGTINKLTLSNDLKTKLKLDTGTYTEAKNAILSMNGTEIVKSSNTFSVDGLQVTLNGTHSASDGKINLNVKVDSDALISQIKEFVNTYNGLIKSVGDKLTEEYYRDFKPLSDDEKEAMSDTEVELWEKKSKSGILRGRTEIDNVLLQMRQALMDKVEGTGLTLSQIGINTTSNYSDRGKLVIEDETKLKNAIENNYSDVVKLFTSESDKKYLDSANASERYKESGLSNRLLDIVNNAVRTTMDENGNRGIFVQYAGVENTATSTQNTLSKRIAEYDTRIDTLLDYLEDKETYYYNMFTQMETAISKLNAQSSVFSSSS